MSNNQSETTVSHINNRYTETDYSQCGTNKFYQFLPIVVFWVVMPRGLVGGYQWFSEILVTTYKILPPKRRHYPASKLNVNVCSISTALHFRWNNINAHNYTTVKIILN
jgi:hypothetical protein